MRAAGIILAATAIPTLSTAALAQHSTDPQRGALDLSALAEGRQNGDIAALIEARGGWVSKGLSRDYQPFYTFTGNGFRAFGYTIDRITVVVEMPPSHALGSGRTEIGQKAVTVTYLIKHGINDLAASVGSTFTLSDIDHRPGLTGQRQIFPQRAGTPNWTYFSKITFEPFPSQQPATTVTIRYPDTFPLDPGDCC